MMFLLLVLLAACGDDAQAGAACRAAEEAVRQGRYEEAIEKLQVALRNQPRESDRLQYRDRDGLHKEPYYPHYVWAEVRSLQARAEKDAARQRQLFRESMTHLELTQHPGAPEMIKTVKDAIAALEKKAATPDPAQVALADLRQKINALCDQENFVEAVKVVGAEKELLDKLPNERTQLLETIQGTRAAVLTRYEKALDLALETMAVTAPLEKPDSLALLLQPVLLPKTVADPAEGRFVWVSEFLATVQARVPELRGLKFAENAAVLACARAFEESAARALKAGTFPGYRAATNIAHSVRWSRIQALSDGSFDHQLNQILADSEDAAAQQDQVLGRSPERDAYRSGVLKPHLDRIREQRNRLGLRMQLRADLERWIARSDQTLTDKATMANPDALRSVAKELAPLEELPSWKEIPAPVRARALYARSILEVVAALLDGEGSAAAALDRAAPGIRAARALDASVDLGWKDRVSPKVKTWLDRLDR